VPYRYQVLFCIMAGITMFLIDTTVVNVALAKLEAVFAVDVATVQWTITGYALASGIITPLADYFTARFGMKQLWLGALTGFTLASVMAGLAPAFPILIVARILQGLSGGLLLPVGISSIFRAFPPDQRGLALGLFAIPIVAGPALGPTVGGYIVTSLDWRLIFFINLPIGVGSVIMASALIRDEREGRQPILDLWGAILASAGFGTILFGLSRIADDGWASLTVMGLVLFGALCLFVLVVHELEIEHPLLEVRLFAIPQFLIGNIVGWTSTIALFGAEFLLPLYLQNLRGLSAFDTGLMLLPQGLSIAVAGPIAGRLTDKIGVRWVAVFGFILLAVNTWNLAHLTLDTDYSTLRLLLIIRGAALGCTMQSAQLVALASVPPRFLTNASSLNTAMRNIFQSFGVGILGVLVQTQTVAHTATLSQQVTATSQGGLFIQRAAAGLLQATPGMSQAAAMAEASSIMLGQVAREASVLAFGDAYRFTFFTALVAIALSLFLPSRRPKGQAAPVTSEGEEVLAVAH
jgi:MFS transporter, DHA2 family, multidrug resistance protein